MPSALQTSVLTVLAVMAPLSVVGGKGLPCLFSKMCIFYSPQFTTGASTAFDCLLIMGLRGCVSTLLDLREG